MLRPIIGLTLDYKDSGGYSTLPWYAIRVNYTSIVSNHGGIPLCLAYDDHSIEGLADLLHGIIIPGGGFNIHPSLYGESFVHPKAEKFNHNRTSFELKMVRSMLKRNKPVLGICGGMQLVNVALGGGLIQHLPDILDGNDIHSQTPPANHEISIVPATQLHHIAKGSFHVNSSHYQAIGRLGTGLKVNAYAFDGVIEGIESEDYFFCMGVQWHPEYEVSPIDTLLMQAFVKAAQKKII